MRTLHLELPDPAATERAGAAIAPCLRGGMLVTLSGELGSGKTTLARGVVRALGWRGPVKSPTYTLVEHYELSSLYLYHIDSYRFADPGEWETSGLAECFDSAAVTLVEWPERLANLLPTADLEFALAVHGSGRLLRATAHTKEGDSCLRALDASFPAPC